MCEPDHSNAPRVQNHSKTEDTRTLFVVATLWDLRPDELVRAPLQGEMLDSFWEEVSLEYPTHAVCSSPYLPFAKRHLSLEYPTHVLCSSLPPLGRHEASLRARHEA